jgi:hypothetical protein
MVIYPVGYLHGGRFRQQEFREVNGNAGQSPPGLTNDAVSGEADR